MPSPCDDNLPAMPARPEKPALAALGRPASWGAIGVVLLAGVLLALRFLRQVTPLLDAVR
jgi:hypothetical protein